MISGTMIWEKSNLTFAQDIVFVKDGYNFLIYYTKKSFPQITAYTNASVIIEV